MVVEVLLLSGLWLWRCCSSLVYGSDGDSARRSKSLLVRPEGSGMGPTGQRRGERSRRGGGEEERGDEKENREEEEDREERSRE